MRATGSVVTRSTYRNAPRPPFAGLVVSSLAPAAQDIPGGADAGLADSDAPWVSAIGTARRGAALQRRFPRAAEPGAFRANIRGSKRSRHQIASGRFLDAVATRFAKSRHGDRCEEMSHRVSLREDPVSESESALVSVNFAVCFTSIFGGWRLVEGVRLSTLESVLAPEVT